ncbi:uncharacterized protein PSFLO_02401 [Pseudozyma flocculosa]|uniref:Uncharacterized protein n=1 Tax=Pseudozyma flocculosa TaxID=84751 RepID=A0A5C3EYI2_9BASI|nr:uncharacterized protein PSFLO_02401 [Pseudozyma flocculosa]
MVRQAGLSLPLLLSAMPCLLSVPAGACLLVAVALAVAIATLADGLLALLCPFGHHCPSGGPLAPSKVRVRIVLAPALPRPCAAVSQLPCLARPLALAKASSAASPCVACVLSYGRVLRCDQEEVTRRRQEGAGERAHERTRRGLPSHEPRACSSSTREREARPHLLASPLRYGFRPKPLLSPSPVLLAVDRRRMRPGQSCVCSMERVDGVGRRLVEEKAERERVEVRAATATHPPFQPTNAVEQARQRDDCALRRDETRSGPLCSPYPPQELRFARPAAGGCWHMCAPTRSRTELDDADDFDCAAPTPRRSGRRSSGGPLTWAACCFRFRLTAGNQRRGRQAVAGVVKTEESARQLGAPQEGGASEEGTKQRGQREAARDRRGGGLASRGHGGARASAPACQAACPPARLSVCLPYARISRQTQNGRLPARGLPTCLPGCLPACSKGGHACWCVRACVVGIRRRPSRPPASLSICLPTCLPACFRLMCTPAIKTITRPIEDVGPGGYQGDN